MIASAVCAARHAAGGTRSMKRSRSPSRRAVVLVTLVGVGVAACAPSVILENPVTKQRVDCTWEAKRLAFTVPTNESTGLEVPPMQTISPEMARFDYERQCRGNLEREGFVCVSGC
jgi:hypothetical protein